MEGARGLNDEADKATIGAEVSFAVARTPLALAYAAELSEAEVVESDLWLMTQANSFLSYGVRHEIEPGVATGLALDLTHSLAWFVDVDIGAGVVGYEAGVFGLYLDAEVSRPLSGGWSMGFGLASEAWSSRQDAFERGEGLNKVELRATISYSFAEQRELFVGISRERTHGETRRIRETAGMADFEEFISVGVRAGFGQ